MTSIFVAKLDFGVTREQLTELFEEYGKVTKVNIPTDKETGKPRGFAFVEMLNQEEAENAIHALDGFEINHRALAVKLADKRGDNRRPTSTTTSRHKKEAYSGADPTMSPSKSESSSDRLPQENRKKSSKNKKRNFDTDGDRTKKTKMPAYKKSGKAFRYFDDDDEPLENDLFSFDKDDDESLEDT